MAESFYKNRSELYLDAAEVLLNDGNGRYAVVPHSAYYSCLLLMEHICYIGKGFKDIDVRPIVNEVQTNLHVGLRNCIVSELNKPAYPFRDYRDFDKKFQLLKRLRVKADYENENVSLDDCQKAVSLAKDILVILKEIKS